MGIVEARRVYKKHFPSVFVDEGMDFDFSGTWDCKSRLARHVLFILQDVNS